MTEWKSIDSAPRDGTWVLAYGNQCHYDEPASQHVVFWDDRHEVWRGGMDGFTDILFASHWQPLPPPPTEETTR